MAVLGEAAIHSVNGGNGMTAAQAQSILGGGGKDTSGAATASKKLSKTKVKALPSTKGKVVGVAAGVGSSSLGESSGAIYKQLESARLENERLELKIKRMESDAKQGDDAKLALDEENNALRRSLEAVQRLAAIRESRNRRDRLASDCVRLGKIVTQRVTNNTVADVWEEGYALKEMQKRQGSLLQRKEDLENRRKAIQMNKKKAARRAAKSDDGPPDFDMDFTTEEAAIRMHLDSLQRDQQSLADEKRLLEEEKASHAREFKRIMHEDRSRFVKSLPLLNGRYLMQMLLGRGGFSEVWKAYDLNDRHEVAVKVHQLNPTWSQDRKNSYIRHVTREYKIHCDMNHPRVVRQFDVFEIDENSFATVLEYCRGTDLDEKLKREKVLPEKIAKTILMQMLSGVRYLHTPSSEAGGRKTVIHYDLKPANILFDERGDVKITDFGLSKMVDESNEGTSMELTSQGAGTYYYLPPECFAKVDAKVSTKVDVWSLGVIYYQMLVGQKPFGEGKSQERILADGIMLLANRDKLHFPDGSDLSEEGKSFIRDCLTSDYKLRPDITELCSSPYICGKSKK
jgi:tousled-like kinase